MTNVLFWISKRGLLLNHRSALNWLSNPYRPQVLVEMDRWIRVNRELHVVPGVQLVLRDSSLFLRNVTAV